MGFNSQAGQVGFGKQSVKGTAVAATRFARLRSGGLGGDRSLLLPDAEVGGGRDHQAAYLGPVGFSGDLDFYPRAQMVAMLLEGALGTAGSSDNGGTPEMIGTHTITPADTLPWYSVEEAQGSAFESFRYTDTKINTFRLEADAAGYLMGSAGLIAMKGESDFTRQGSPTWDETPLFVGSKVTFSFGGVDLRAKSFSLEINNNIENDDFRLGSVYMFDAVGKRREVKMTASYRPEDSDLWKYAMWGSNTVSEAQAGSPAYQGAVTVTIESYELMDPGGADQPYSISFSFPAAVIAPFKVTPSGDDIIGSDIELTAIRPSSASPLVTATVIDNLATINE